MTRYIVHDRRNSARDILGMLFAGEIPPNRIYLTRASAERDKFPTEDVFPVSAYAGINSRRTPENKQVTA